MRTLLTFVFCSFLSVSALSADTSSLTVDVVDPQGAPVAGAVVHLSRRAGDFRLQAATDASGRYRNSTLAPGVYLVSAQARGFARSAAREVRLTRAAGQTVSIPLDIAAVQENVVVTSAATSQPLGEVTKSMSVVDKEELESRDEYFIPEALRTVPGLRVQQLGGPGAFTNIKTRGLRSEDTAVLIDGARFRDVAAPQGDASGFLETFIATDLEQVEILRGTGSTLYGTNAGGGVINVVTSAGGGETRGNLLAEGGGLGFFRAGAQTGGGYGDRLLYSAGIAHVNVAEGVDGNDEYRNTSVQGRLLAQLSPTASLSFRLYGSDARVGLNESPEAIGALPPGVIDAAAGINFRPPADDPDSERESQFASALVTFEQRPRADFGYSVRYHGLFTDRSFRDGPEGITDFEPVRGSLSEFKGDVHTLSARTDFEWGPYQLLHAGYELESESFENGSFPDDPTVSSVANVSQSSHTLYLQDQVQLLHGSLTIAGGARAQFFSLDQPSFTPPENAPFAGMSFASPDDAVTGDVSGIYAFRESGTKVRAHYGSGYRAPSLFERFGSSFSSFGYSIFGDPRLAPEKTRTFDVGLEQDFLSGRARATATYFRTRLSQIIVFDFSGAIDPGTDPFGRFGGYRSTDGGVTEGVEATGEFSVTPELGVNASYTFTDAEPPAGVSGDQSRAFVVPRHQFSLIATHRIGSSFRLSFDLVASGSYLAPIFDPGTFESRVYRFEGFVKSDLVASYRLNSLRLFAKIENVFDEEIFDGGFRTPGRYALAGVSLEF